MLPPRVIKKYKQQGHSLPVKNVMSGTLQKIQGDRVV